GNSWLCVRRGGNCRFGRCQFAERQIGRCSAFQPCCGR
nr:Chain A, Avian beta-defensin 3 [Anas platyrhynchos]